MLTRRQTRKVETEPMESDYWQSKTEALDAEYWEPFWAARIVFIGGVVFLAAVTISIILVPLIWPREWYNMVGGLFGAGLLLVSLLRQKKRMRLTKSNGRSANPRLRCSLNRESENSLIPLSLVLLPKGPGSGSSNCRLKGGWYKGSTVLMSATGFAWS